MSVIFIILIVSNAIAMHDPAPFDLNVALPANDNESPRAEDRFLEGSAQRWPSLHSFHRLELTGNTQEFPSSCILTGVSMPAESVGDADQDRTPAFATRQLPPSIEPDYVDDAQSCCGPRPGSTMDTDMDDITSAPFPLNLSLAPNSRFSRNLSGSRTTRQPTLLQLFETTRSRSRSLSNVGSNTCMEVDVPSVGDMLPDDDVTMGENNVPAEIDFFSQIMDETENIYHRSGSGNNFFPLRSNGIRRDDQFSAPFAVNWPTPSIRPEIAPDRVASNYGKMTAQDVHSEPDETTRRSRFVFPFLLHDE